MTALHLRAVLLPDEVERDVWVRDDAFTLEPVPGAETVVARGWALPGLVDAHCHVGLGPDGAVSPDGAEAQARADRDAGALLLRDCGSPVDTRWVDDREDLPRILRAGRHLARSRRYLKGVGLELEPEALPAAAAEQAGLGDGWVKLVGDWIDREAGDLAPCWPAEAVVAAVEAAHAAGARVTAHTFGEQAPVDLVAAGIDCLEHGTGIGRDLLDVMAARGVALVPTLVNVANFPGIADSATRFPRYADHMRRLHARSGELVRSAWEAGVAIYAGSDAGSAVPHGLVADEVAALHAAGLPAADALASGSWGARRWLGLPGIEEGAPADLVAYDEDPRTDLSALRRPARVILRGRVVA